MSIGRRSGRGWTSGAATGAPLLLPNVGDIYLNDSLAFPANRCEGCDYLLPVQSRLRADGTYRHLRLYEGECPSCGRDTHREEADTP
jgi:hypothetical protein